MAWLNLVSDPVLRQRQESLNAQWFALNQTIDSCALTASSAPAFSQFYADYDAWKSFFESGWDWSSDSANATNRYQSKLQEYTTLAKQYCVAASGAEPAYIPGVKDPPKDDKSLFEKGTELAETFVETPAKIAEYLGIATVVVVAAILFTIIYVSTKGSFSAGAHGVSVGK